MSPSEEAGARLRRLIRDLDDDLAAMESRAGEIAAAAGRPATAEVVALLAVALHHYYTAFEAALERTLRFLDGDVPAGADWHRALLREAARPLPGIRPEIVSPATLPDWEELLRFRHFFRHAYAVALDGARLAAQAARVERVQALARLDFAHLRGRLEQAIRELEAAR